MLLDVLGSEEALDEMSAVHLIAGLDAGNSCAHRASVQYDLCALTNNTNAGRLFQVFLCCNRVNLICMT